MRDLQERKRELKTLLFNLAIEKNRATDEQLREVLEQSHQEVMYQLNKVRKEIEILVEEKEREFWNDFDFNGLD
ncbi:TreU [Staphylococcus phage VB-SavM-JYL02]|uniref:TreU n=2 Tax=Kayvirus P108 TaxID=1924731 RepID=A0A3T0IDV2_9CAUD|nr:TreU [Staphylococcus phage VB_SavM_JYL01]AZU97593.1 TreU [Staphylococcus phage VB-SavM-JYL02]